MKRLKIKSLFLVGVCVVSVGAMTGCRGYRSSDEPVHLNPNFDWQPKVKAQVDPRSVPEGTVPWGHAMRGTSDPYRAVMADEGSAYFTGRNESGDWVARIPATVDSAMMDRGQERYNIYCAVCHSQTGAMKTPVINRGFVPPPLFSDPRLLASPDGYFFDVITNGVRTMPAYRKQIPVADRWAIVLYLRALQKSRTATIDDVPESLRRQLK